MAIGCHAPTDFTRSTRYWIIDERDAGDLLVKCCGIGKEGWGTVNGYTAEDLAALPRLTKMDLLDHLEAVYDATRAFIKATPMTVLTEAAPGFEGHYAKYQVLSMAMLDNVRHLGEIYLLQALWERGPAKDRLSEE